MSFGIEGKVALLADIHGNAIALEQIVKAISPHAPNAWFFLGDSVGYFPAGNEVLRILKSLGCICIIGNHEEMLLKGDFSHNEEYYKLAVQNKTILTEHRSWIATWPRQLTGNFGTKTALLVHGSPEDTQRGYIYPDGDLSVHERAGVDILFTAHTHRPFFTSLAHFSLCNVGSVGLPRDGSKCATALIFDTEEGNHVFVRCKLDFATIRTAYEIHTHPLIFNRIER